MGNDSFIGFELGIVNPIQEFLKNGMEDLNRRCDGDQLWFPCPVARERPIVYGCS